MLLTIGVETMQSGQRMTPGGAARFVLARRSTPDKVVAEMRRFGGTVLRTNLFNDAEQRLLAALSEPSA